MSAGRSLLAALLVAVTAATAAGGEPSHATRRQLRELRMLCDEGVVAPAVCLEKQRAILGLAGADHGGPASEASVAMHESPLGFRVELPAGWSVVPPEQIDAGFDTLNARLAADPAAAALVDRLREHGARRGGEVYAVAGDRLQVMRMRSPLPDDPTARAARCAALASATSKAAGRTLATQACRPRTVAGRPALWIERDALLPGSRTLQYWVSTPDGAGMAFVMSCLVEDVDTRRPELERLVDSLRWQR